MVTVIIPVYNVETYLERCLESIINQTYKELEIIIVDDGSTDKSSQICDTYKTKDTRICVYHKKNGGLSDARNYGLDRMNGEYVTFVDSDDYISRDYIEVLYRLIKKNDNIDISMMDKQVVYDNDVPRSTIEFKEEIMDREHAIKKMLLRDGVSHTAWGKLYKSVLWKEIRFPFGRLYEDYLTIYKVFENVNMISYCNEKKYYYYQRSNSIMNNKLNKKKLTELDVTDEISSYLMEKYHSCTDEILDLKISIYLKNLYDILTTDDNSNKEFRESEEKIVKYIKKVRKKAIFSRKIPKKEKVKIISFSLGKKCFIKVYELGKKNNYKKIKKKVGG